MAVRVEIKPSPQARRLFNAMVVKADDGHLTLPSTLMLAVERTRAGSSDGEAVDELRSEGWIRQAKDGGWLVH